VHGASLQRRRKYSISHSDEEDWLARVTGGQSESTRRRTRDEIFISLAVSPLSSRFSFPSIPPPPLSLFLSLYLRACESQSVFASRSKTGGGGGGGGGGGRTERKALFFHDRIFTSRPSPCALTSIACPFGIRVHYEITGSLCEIHPPFLSLGLVVRPFLRPCFPCPLTVLRPAGEISDLAPDTCARHDDGNAGNRDSLE